MASLKSDPGRSAGGGNATTAGIAFQANVASFFGAALLGEAAVDRFFELGRIVPFSIRVETEAPVDDLLIETTAGGFIFIQAKSSIRFESASTSPFGKTVDQFVRQWMVCAAGSGARGWDRHFRRLLGDPASKRLVGGEPGRCHRESRPCSCERWFRCVQSSCGDLISERSGVFAWRWKWSFRLE
jgi:hypothetical protein